jgi:hypothetical protein
VLREISKGKMEKRKKLKIYSLFYVDPMSPLTGVWNVWVIIMIYVMLFQISLTIGFGPEFWQEELKQNLYLVGFIMSFVSLVVDMIINFHKGYYLFGRGRVINEPELIIKNYLKTYFPMEIISIGGLT